MYFLNVSFFILLLLAWLPYAQTAPINTNSLSESKGIQKKNSRERPWISLGVDVGIQFNSLQQRSRLTDYSVNYRTYQQQLDNAQASEYNTNQGVSDTATVGSSKVLQPYQPVDIAIPVGLSLYIKLLSSLDLLLSVQSFWREQVEIIEYENLSFVSSSGISGGDIQNIPLKYGLQAHLGGIGGKFHIPVHFMSIDKSKPIVIQVQRLWHLWRSEIYTSHGTLPATFEPLGNGWEFSAGYSWKTLGPLQITTYLSYFTASFSSSRTWSQLMASSQGETYLDQHSWTLNGLKLQLQLQYIP
jgi:hypothetical protein